MNPRAIDRPWAGVWALDQAMDRRYARPRTVGITMVIDSGLGVAATEDLLGVAAAHIDHWKFGFGTSALVPLAVLSRKLECLAAEDVITYPGGTLLEAAIMQQHCRVFMRRAKALGFRAVEVSDGTIELPKDRRRRVIGCAIDAGLIVLSEVGSKDPTHQPEPEALAEQAALDIEWGSQWVVIEGRESGEGIGVYDSHGGIKQDYLETIVSHLGENANRLIWEAPKKSQQAYLIQRFGPNVGLGNIDPGQVIALEALRSGLRFETLSSIAEQNRKTRRWDPAQVESPFVSALVEAE
ncbi:phosphosulfolactate synthase [Bradyrhizobium japonicum]|uniref:Phosphosulfolactate synthase n=1 Tax=Bradyrhizobium japonicum TaxID=375 RepID=A0A1Y2JEE4_BRAJP|nr:phosphosulfolactate synthase [Bradyrhizobium japonicum]OSJ26569.1 phosphosulfolactate synthase [Bradyrhizobium japonicum]